MDQSVKDAIARWPRRAGGARLAVAGRARPLALSPQGLSAQGGPGESITNPQILDFIGRNYAHDDAGRWFFQNGRSASTCSGWTRPHRDQTLRWINR